MQLADCPSPAGVVTFKMMQLVPNINARGVGALAWPEDYHKLADELR